MKILNVDILCGFMLVTSMLQSSHNVPAQGQGNAGHKIFIIDTPIIDTIASFPSLDSERMAAEIKVKKSLKETSVRISRIHRNRGRNRVEIPDTVILTDTINKIPDCPTNSTRKKGFFKRLFKINQYEKVVPK